MILELSIALSTILCIMKARAPCLVTFRSVMPAAAYIFFMILPSLWIPTGALRNHLWKKRHKKMQVSGKSFWIIYTKCPQIRRTPAFFIHKILPSFSNIYRFPYTTLVVLVVSVIQRYIMISLISHVEPSYLPKQGCTVSQILHQCSQECAKCIQYMFYIGRHSRYMVRNRENG